MRDVEWKRKFLEPASDGLKSNVGIWRGINSGTLENRWARKVPWVRIPPLRHSVMVRPGHMGDYTFIHYRTLLPRHDWRKSATYVSGPICYRCLKLLTSLSRIIPRTLSCAHCRRHLSQASLESLSGQRDGEHHRNSLDDQKPISFEIYVRFFDCRQRFMESRFNRSAMHQYLD